MIDWDEVGSTDSDERIMVSHNWDEIRRLMWNYVRIEYFNFADGSSRESSVYLCFVFVVFMYVHVCVSICCFNCFFIIFSSLFMTLFDLSIN